MSLLSKLLGGKGEVKGRVSLLNRPSNMDYMVVVEAFPVSENAPPPFPGEPPEELRDKKRIVACPPQQLEFELQLPAGHYQFFLALIPVLLEGQRAELDPSQRFPVWPMPRAISVQSGQTRHVNLKVDLKDAGTQAWKMGEPAESPPQEEEEEQEGSELPLFKRLPPPLKALFGKAIQHQQTGNHAEAVPAFDAVLAEIAPGMSNSMDLKELSVFVKTCKAKSLMALGRDADALEALKDPPQGLRTQDPTSFIDYMYTQTDVHGRLGGLDNMTVAMNRTLDLCHRAEAHGPFHKTVQLGLYWTREKAGAAAVLNLARILRQRPEVARTPAVTLLIDEFRWDAAHELGQPQACREIARTAIQALKDLQAPRESDPMRRWQERLRAVTPGAPPPS